MKSVKCPSCNEVTLIEEDVHFSECLCDYCEKPLADWDDCIKQVECVDCGKSWMERVPGWVECPDCEQTFWADEDGDSLTITQECPNCDVEFEINFTKWVTCPNCNSNFEVDDDGYLIDESAEEDTDIERVPKEKEQGAERKILEFIEEFGVTSDYQPLEYGKEEDLEEFEEKDEVYFDNKVLLDLASKSFNKDNPFRILGVDVLENERNIRKQADKLKLQNKLKAANDFAGFLLPLASPPPNEEEIQEALQKLNHPQIRLVYELFWIWPFPDNATVPDDGYQHLANGDIDEAISSWERDIDNEELSDLCTHNIAVTSHTHALDIITGNEIRNGTNGTTAYKKALFFWNLLLSKDKFWDRLITRVKVYNDPRIQTQFVGQVKESIPLFMAVTGCSLGLDLLHTGNKELAVTIIDITRDELPGDAFISAARHTCKPYVGRLSAFCTHISQKAKSSPGDGVKYFEELITEGSKILRTISLILPLDDGLRHIAHDKMLHSAHDCIYNYVEKTEDWSKAKELLEKLVPFAIRNSDKEEEQKRINVALYNKDVHLLNELMEISSKIIKTLQSHASSLNAVLGCSNKVKTELLPLLNKIKETQGEDSKLYIDATTVYCLTVNNLAITLNNDHQDYDFALKLITQAISLTADPETKKRLLQGASTVRNNRDQKASVGVARRNKSGGAFAWVAGAIFFLIILSAIGENSTPPSRRTSIVSNYSQNTSRYPPSTNFSSNKSYSTPAVREVSSKQELKKVQIALNVMGYSCGYPDGIFGTRSRSALKQYQSSNSLTSDGRITETIKNRVLQDAYKKYESRIKQLVTQLDSYKADLSSMQSRINVYEYKQALTYSEQAQYKRLIDEYNELVNKYNSRLEQSKKLYQEAKIIYNLKD